MRKNGVRIEHVKDDLLLELLILLLLFLTSGFVVCNDIISSAMTIGLWLVFAVVLLFGTLTLDKNSVICYMVLIICMSLSTIVSNESLWTLSIRIFSFSVVLCLVNVYTLTEFKNAYINVVAFLAIISLVGFSLLTCIPALKNLFVVRNSANGLYSNWILYVHPQGYTRNLGIFWEPGAFQTFLCLALALELLNKRINMKNVIIFIVTIITTFSTTGYIALVVILLLPYFGKNTSEKIKKAIFIIAMIAVVLVFLFQDELFNTSTNSPFGKIVSYINDEDADKKVTSTSVRINGIIQPFYAFLSNPIFGIGYEGLNKYAYEYTHNMNTCTFINWFAVYGIGYGLTMLHGFFGFSRKLTWNTRSKRFSILLVMLILFLITASENYVDNPFFVTLALYGVMPETGGELNANTHDQLL